MLEKRALQADRHVLSCSSLAPLGQGGAVMGYAFVMLSATSLFMALTGESAPTFGFGMLACQSAYYLGRLHEQQKRSCKETH